MLVQHGRTKEDSKKKVAEAGGEPGKHGEELEAGSQGLCQL